MDAHVMVEQPDDPAHDAETEAASLPNRIRHYADLIKFVEDARQMLFRNSYPCILDVDANLRAFALAVQPHEAALRIPDGVAQEIAQHLGKERRIGANNFG